MTNESFRSMLRVSHDQFQILLNLIEENPVFQERKMLQFPVPVQLAIFLYRIGHYGSAISIQNIATQFGIGDGSSVTKVTRRVKKVPCYSCI
jgi:hypothetical protein